MLKKEVSSRVHFVWVKSKIFGVCFKRMQYDHSPWCLQVQDQGSTGCKLVCR